MFVLLTTWRYMYINEFEGIVVLILGCPLHVKDIVVLILGCPLHVKDIVVLILGCILHVKDNFYQDIIYNSLIGTFVVDHFLILSYISHFTWNQNILPNAHPRATFLLIWCSECFGRNFIAMTMVIETHNSRITLQYRRCHNVWCEKQKWVIVHRIFINI